MNQQHHHRNSVSAMVDRRQVGRLCQLTETEVVLYGGDDEEEGMRLWSQHQSNKGSKNNADNGDDHGLCCTSREQHRRMKNHFASDPVTAMAVSTDRRRVALGTKSGQTRVYCYDGDASLTNTTAHPFTRDDRFDDIMIHAPSQGAAIRDLQFFPTRHSSDDQQSRASYWLCMATAKGLVIVDAATAVSIQRLTEKKDKRGIEHLVFGVVDHNKVALASLAADGWWNVWDCGSKQTNDDPCTWRLKKSDKSARPCHPSFAPRLLASIFGGLLLVLPGDKTTILQVRRIVQSQGSFVVKDDVVPIACNENEIEPVVCLATPTCRTNRMDASMNRGRPFVAGLRDGSVVIWNVQEESCGNQLKMVTLTLLRQLVRFPARSPVTSLAWTQVDGEQILHMMWADGRLAHCRDLILREQVQDPSLPSESSASLMLGQVRTKTPCFPAPKTQQTKGSAKTLKGARAAWKRDGAHKARGVIPPVKGQATFSKKLEATEAEQCVLEYVVSKDLHPIVTSQGTDIKPRTGGFYQVGQRTPLYGDVSLRRCLCQVGIPWTMYRHPKLQTEEGKRRFEMLVKYWNVKPGDFREGYREMTETEIISTMKEKLELEEIRDGRDALSYKLEDQRELHQKTKYFRSVIGLRDYIRCSDARDIFGKKWRRGGMTSEEEANLRVWAARSPTALPKPPGILGEEPSSLHPGNSEDCPPRSTEREDRKGEPSAQHASTFQARTITDPGISGRHDAEMPSALSHASVAVGTNSASLTVEESNTGTQAVAASKDHAGQGGSEKASSATEDPVARKKRELKEEEDKLEMDLLERKSKLKRLKMERQIREVDDEISKLEGQDGTL